jgi:hypothetical protein
MLLEVGRETLAMQPNDKVRAAGAFDVDFRTDVAARSRGMSG